MSSSNSTVGRILATPTAIALALIVIAIGGALLFQHIGDYSPCALCVIQRLAMTAVAVLLIVAQFDRAALWRGSLSAIAGLVALGALGAGIYQVYLNIVPGMSCSAKLMLTINDLPSARWLPDVYAASSDCVLFNPTVFELAMPYAAVGVDALLVICAGVALRQACAPRRMFS